MKVVKKNSRITARRDPTVQDGGFRVWCDSADGGKTGFAGECDVDRLRAPRNRTLRLTEPERVLYRQRLLYPDRQPLEPDRIRDRTICADLFAIIDLLPRSFADLLFIDPPYNLDKDFHGMKFSSRSDEAYLAYLERWLPRLLATLKPSGSVYVCSDWRSSSCVYRVLATHAVVRNRITWQREKGRGAAANWKTSCEDIWFATMGKTYHFDLEAVKLKRRVLAPYRDQGQPKDWHETGHGRFRLTHPGNFWDDITVPYWSMPENTDHPTQKPEKLLAKLILASCPRDGIVLDPFLGSGTGSVAAKKLGRQYVGIELNEEYCLWAEKRLAEAERDAAIQGYCGGVFWERNTFGSQTAERRKARSAPGSDAN